MKPVFKSKVVVGKKAETSSEEDSSSEEPVVKKKVVTQSLKVKSPEDEYAEKQKQWKETFQSSK